MGSIRFLARIFIHAALVFIVLGAAFALFSHTHLTLDHQASQLVALEPSGTPTKPVDWTPDNPKRVRILAIDGGGRPRLLDLIRQFGRQYVVDNHEDIRTVVKALGYTVTPAIPGAATAPPHDQPGHQTVRDDNPA